MAFFQSKRLFINRKLANTLQISEIAGDLRIPSFSVE
jgi:hypothetical protein